MGPGVHVGTGDRSSRRKSELLGRMGGKFDRLPIVVNDEDPQTGDRDGGLEQLFALVESLPGQPLSRNILVDSLHSYQNTSGVSGGTGAAMNPDRLPVRPNNPQVVGEFVSPGQHCLDTGDRDRPVVRMKTSEEGFEAGHGGTDWHAEQFKLGIRPPHMFGQRLPTPTSEAGNPLRFPETGVGLPQQVLRPL